MREAKIQRHLLCTTAESRGQVVLLPYPLDSRCALKSSLSFQGLSTILRSSTLEVSINAASILCRRWNLHGRTSCRASQLHRFLHFAPQADECVENFAYNRFRKGSSHINGSWCSVAHARLLIAVPSAIRLAAVPKTSACSASRCSLQFAAVAWVLSHGLITSSQTLVDGLALRS